MKSVPSKRSSVRPGDRVLEINGVKYTEFKSVKKANELLDTLILDVHEQTQHSSEEDYFSSDSQIESEEF